MVQQQCAPLQPARDGRSTSAVHCSHTQPSHGAAPLPCPGPSMPTPLQCLQGSAPVPRQRLHLHRASRPSTVDEQTAWQAHNAVQGRLPCRRQSRSVPPHLPHLLLFIQSESNILGSFSPSSTCTLPAAPGRQGRLGAKKGFLAQFQQQQTPIQETPPGRKQRAVPWATRFRLCRWPPRGVHQLAGRTCVAYLVHPNLLGLHDASALQRHRQRGLGARGRSWCC